MPIHQLFPEPLYFSKFKRSITKEELKAINKLRNKTHLMTGQQTSNENYVLDQKPFKNLKKDFIEIINYYFDKVICTTPSLIPFITQSWVNFTKNDEFLHRHSHPNSYVSGVFYVAATKEVDKIKFWKSGFERLVPDVTNYNIFNSRSWWYPVETGDILLFPSSLDHEVKNKKGNNDRISLAFNIFFKGPLGDKSDKYDLSELIIR